MARRLRFSPRVRSDLEQAVAWYRKSSPATSERFKQAVLKALSRIERNPAAFAVSFESYRVAVAKPFPYLVVYDFDDAILNVIAVVHASGDSAGWLP